MNNKGATAKAAKRHRAPMRGGYRRTTITIPEDLAKQVDVHLEKEEGLTMSAYVSDLIKVSQGQKKRRS